MKTCLTRVSNNAPIVLIGGALLFRHFRHGGHRMPSTLEICLSATVVLGIAAVTYWRNKTA